MTLITDLSINPEQLDASAALPVSQRTILGEYVMDYNNISGLLSREGTGSQVYGNGVNVMSVGVGQYEVCQSFQSHPYFAGKSQDMSITFGNLENEVGIVKEAGLYTTTLAAPYNTNYDGFFIEADGTTYNLVIANANTGSVIRIPKASWDYSDIALDFTKFTVMKLDFLYLGGTSVRFYFKTENGWELAHTYNHSNLVAGTICASPNLPVRWSVRSTTGTGSFDQICASVNTEGQTGLVGRVMTTPVVSDPIDANIVGTTYMLAAIRLATPKKAIIDLEKSILSTTNDNVWISLIYNPTIANEPAWTEFTDETGQALGCEYVVGDTVSANSNTTVTGGFEFWGGFLGSQDRQADRIAKVIRSLGFSLNNVADKIALCGRPLTGGSNANLYATLTPTIK